MTKISAAYSSGHCKAVAAVCVSLCVRCCGSASASVGMEGLRPVAGAATARCAGRAGGRFKAARGFSWVDLFPWKPLPPIPIGHFNLTHSRSLCKHNKDSGARSEGTTKHGAQYSHYSSISLSASEQGITERLLLPPTSRSNNIGIR